MHWEPVGTGNRVNDMGTVNRVNKTDYFCVGSVSPTAGGLTCYTLGTQGTIRKHREHTRNILRTIGKIGNRIQSGTHWELGTK